MKGLGALAVAVLAGWSFLDPRHASWACAAAEFVFLVWLARELRRANAQAVRGGASQPLEPDEADLVQRYPLYFARPAFAREAASTLAAIGLASLVLVPWFTYKLQWAPAILIAIFLFPVGRLTKLLSPVYALRLATAKGDRDALRLLSAHDGAARKLSGLHVPEPVDQGGAGR